MLQQFLRIFQNPHLIYTISRINSVSISFVTDHADANYIPEIKNFGDIMVLVWTHPPPHPKACVSHNCDTNARIKFIYDTAIDDLEWKNPIDFGENRKTKMAGKYDEQEASRPDSSARFWHLLGNPRLLNMADTSLDRFT